MAAVNNTYIEMAELLARSGEYVEDRDTGIQPQEAGSSQRVRRAVADRLPIAGPPNEKFANRYALAHHFPPRRTVLQTP